LADTWKYSLSRREWAWVNGPKIVNFVGNSSLPGSREDGDAWKVPTSLPDEDLILVYGGRGLMQGEQERTLRDMWAYDTSQNEWKQGHRTVQWGSTYRSRHGMLEEP